MHSHTKTGAIVWGALVLGILSAAGCAKLSPVDSKGPAVASAVNKPAAERATAEASDPATLLAFKTGVARDKVEQILSIYETNAQASESGRDIYKIALFASERTGLPTSQVGSVILSYKALVGDGAVKAVEETKKG
ncbi:MAG: hypothetical protein HY900_04450 [Deltaproteobacteria bacterium]|nr:hypothetical protein [Deltaproteobacteria bacterium]